jgi:transcription termination/antitermination protein NusG
MIKEDVFFPAWYVLHTRSRFETVVYDGLLKKSKEVFLPKVRVRSKRRDRKLMIDLPLFPGYLFVRSDLEPRDHLDILKTVGVVRLIGNKEGPLAVPEDTIHSLRIMVTAQQEIQTGFQLKQGDPVMVMTGPFAGIQGVFVRYRGRDRGRVVVNIDALGQFAAVEIDADEVEVLPIPGDTRPLLGN